MIERYVHNLFQNRIPENKGYVYVTTETIAVPIYKVTLGISKRRVSDLELVEEMILRLSSIGVSNLDTISGVLGLPREIIDITAGDLHLKNLAYHSSGNCILMDEGRRSLKNLSVTNREKDILRNVFVDAITGKISGEKDSNYGEGFIYNNTKMKHIVDANSIDHYRRNMDNIRDIFSQSLKAFMGNNMNIQDELVSIDSIDDVITGFISTPIHIFVSENGYEIDIAAQRRSQRKFLDDHKEAIIEQLRTRKLLPNLTTYSSSAYPYSKSNEGNSTQEVYEILKDAEAALSIVDFEKQALDILLSPRKLFENELIDFCDLIFSKATKIELFIDNLNYWSKNSKFLTICSFVKPGTLCYIYYANSSNNPSSALRKIKNSCPNIPDKQIQIHPHSKWFQISIDSRFDISTYSNPIKIFAENRYILHKESYITEEKQS